MNKSNWKGFERKIAEFFGCRRTPLSGSNSGHNTNSDTLHDTLYVECKKRKKIALVELWKDTQRQAKKENKIPVVAVAQTGVSGSFLFIHIDDLTAIANQRLIAKKAF